MVTKRLSKAALLTLARCPVAIVEAFNTLSAHGVDRVKLFRLIETRKKTGGGRPTKAEEIARLDYSVTLYQEEHPGTELREAIRKVLEKDGVQAYVYDEKLKKAVLQQPKSDYTSYSESKRKAAVHRLATALTRFRKTQERTEPDHK